MNKFESNLEARALSRIALRKAASKGPEQTTTRRTSLQVKYQTLERLTFFKTLRCLMECEYLIRHPSATTRSNHHQITEGLIAGCPGGCLVVACLLKGLRMSSRDAC